MSRMVLQLEIRYRQSGREESLRLEIVREVICSEKKFTPCLLLPMTSLTRRRQRIVGENSLDILSTQWFLLACDCAICSMSAHQRESTRPFADACFECSKLLVEQDWILFIGQFSDWFQHSVHP